MVDSTTPAPVCTRPAAPDRHPPEGARGAATIPLRRAPPGIHGPRTSGHGGRGIDQLLALLVLRWLLRHVLLTRVGAVRTSALDDLAGAVRVRRSGVLDAVLEVDERGVGARPAVDGVLLAVADADGVVALVTADRVARGLVAAMDVAAREREQRVVARPAARDVDAAVGEDRVVARPAALVVRPGAARHQIVA